MAVCHLFGIESLSKVIHGNFINWRISFAGIPEAGSAGRHLCVKVKQGCSAHAGSYDSDNNIF